MSERRLQVALVHQLDTRSVKNWSGTLFYSRRAVQRHLGDVIDLGRPPISLLPFKVARQVIRRTTGRWYSYDHDLMLSRLYGAYFRRRVGELRPDLIFAPAASACLGYLETEVPIVYFSDATFRVLAGYHAGLTNLLTRTARGGEELERRAIQRAAVCLFSSEWAARSAVEDYGGDPEKVWTVYIGANLTNPPARESVLPRSPGKRIRLLMVGVSWEHKGGPIALDTLRRLLAMGYDAELTVVGCQPPEGTSHPRMTVIPYLNKQKPSDADRFERLWREATVFLLPTRFDAAGIVFCEAAAYALPAFGTRTGGVPDLVVDGQTGRTLPPEAGGDEYAEEIAAVVSDPARYERMSRASRDEFESRLNWDSWGARVAEIVGRRLPHLRDRLKVDPGTTRS